jgi:hypothetical protein
MTRSEKKTRIPPFRSDQAERDFWARHSVEEFARDLTDLVDRTKARLIEHPFSALPRHHRTLSGQSP